MLKRAAPGRSRRLAGAGAIAVLAAAAGAAAWAANPPQERFVDAPAQAGDVDDAVNSLKPAIERLVRQAPAPAPSSPPATSQPKPQPTRYEPQAVAPELKGLPWILQDRADPKAPLSLRGVIAAVEWLNPAVRIHVQEDGTGKAWVVETSTPNALLRLGASKAVMHEGAAIVAQGFAPLDKACAEACLMYAAPAHMTFSGAALKPPGPAPARYVPQQAAPRTPPQADFVPFASLFDADDPILVQGKVTRIDLTRPYAYIWLQASEASEKGKPGLQPNTNAFRAMLGRTESTPDWINMSLIGKEVTVRGYRAKDKTCTDTCLINGRDLTVDGAKRSVTSTPAAPSPRPIRYEPQQEPQQAPLRINANTGNYVQAEGRAVYTGDVQMSQGDLKLAADTLTVTCQRPASADCDRVQGLVADGHVVFTDPDISISGDRADYDVAAGAISFTGDVTTRRGNEGVVRSPKAVYRTADRQVTVSGDRVTSSPN
jgi:lipopolysaccharide export system protein LptA